MFSIHGWVRQVVAFPNRQVVMRGMYLRVCYRRENDCRNDLEAVMVWDESSICMWDFLSTFPCESE